MRRVDNGKEKREKVDNGKEGDKPVKLISSMPNFVDAVYDLVAISLNDFAYFRQILHYFTVLW